MKTKTAYDKLVNDILRCDVWDYDDSSSLPDRLCCHYDLLPPI